VYCPHKFRNMSKIPRRIQRLGARRLHGMSDVNFQRNRVVDANQPGDEAYTGIALACTGIALACARSSRRSCRPSVLGSHAFG